MTRGYVPEGPGVSAKEPYNRSGKIHGLLNENVPKCPFFCQCLAILFGGFLTRPEHPIISEEKEQYGRD
jgi:hypothetical protein